MAANDWMGVSVPSKNYVDGVYKKFLTEKGIKDDHIIRSDVYKSIFEKLGVKNVTEVRPAKRPYSEATRVKKAVRKAFVNAAKYGSKKPKPLIIGFDHSAMAYAFFDPDISYLYFDEHTDTLKSEDFHCASFINFMGGKHYIIGSSDIPKDDGKAGDELIVFGGNRRDLKKAKKVLQEKLGNKVFLSIELDVLRPRFTTAHEFDKDGKMSPRQIKRLSENLLKERELIGLNLSAYDPCIEHPRRYKTVDIIIDLIKPML